MRKPSARRGDIRGERRRVPVVYDTQSSIRTSREEGSIRRRVTGDGPRTNAASSSRSRSRQSHRLRIPAARWTHRRISAARVVPRLLFPLFLSLAVSQPLVEIPIRDWFVAGGWERILEHVVFFHERLRLVVLFATKPGRSVLFGAQAPFARTARPRSPRASRPRPPSSPSFGGESRRRRHETSRRRRARRARARTPAPEAPVPGPGPSGAENTPGNVVSAIPSPAIPSRATHASSVPTTCRSFSRSFAVISATRASASATRLASRSRAASASGGDPFGVATPPSAATRRVASPRSRDAASRSSSAARSAAAIRAACASTSASRAAASTTILKIAAAASRIATAAKRTS